MKAEIAIHFDDSMHSTSWAPIWAHACEIRDWKFSIVNSYAPSFFDDMQSHQYFLWHFSHYSHRDMVFARNWLRVAREYGVCTFPSDADVWHFDDKVAQSAYLQSLNIATPASWCFFNMDSVEEWLATRPKFPVVAKLRGGSGSQNVLKLNSVNAVRRYAARMLRGNGFRPVPSIVFKAKSNFRSARTFQQFINRIKRIPDFLLVMSQARTLPRERGYVYLQEFIPNDGFDIKVVVVGEKLSYFVRSVRRGDFRASGGADFFYDRTLVSSAVRDLCWSASRKIGASCMGYDIVIDSRNGEPKIIEMSYGFSRDALLGAGGYWTPNDGWIDAPLDAPVELLVNLVEGRISG